jgi:hypothetical protein
MFERGLILGTAVLEGEGASKADSGCDQYETPTHASPHETCPFEHLLFLQAGYLRGGHQADLNVYVLSNVYPSRVSRDVSKAEAEAEAEAESESVNGLSVHRENSDIVV